MRPLHLCSLCAITVSLGCSPIRATLPKACADVAEVEQSPELITDLTEGLRDWQPVLRRAPLYQHVYGPEEQQRVAAWEAEAERLWEQNSRRAEWTLAYIMAESGVSSDLEARAAARVYASRSGATRPVLRMLLDYASRPPRQALALRTIRDSVRARDVVILEYLVCRAELHRTTLAAGLTAVNLSDTGWVRSWTADLDEVLLHGRRLLGRNSGAK